MAAWWIAPVVSAIGAAWSSSKASEAHEEGIEQQIAFLREAMAPYMEQAEWGLPAYRNIISGSLIPKIGRESPYLKTALKQQLAGIGRGERREMAEIQRYYPTNVGRGLGARWRARRGAERARGQAKVSYGQAQEQYKLGNITAALGALGNLTRLGSAGLAPAMQAAGAMGQAGAAGAGAWSGVAGGFGTLLGAWENEQYRRQMEQLLAKEKSSFGGGLSFPTTAFGSGGGFAGLQ